MKSLFVFLLFVQGIALAEIGSNAVAPAGAEGNSIFSKKQKLEADGTELYKSNLEMKDYKKFGFGVSMGGATGLVGLNFEANLDPTEALALGLGSGPSYNTFAVAWKHNFIGNYISPYTKVGYSKWFNSSGRSSSAADSDILKRVLSDEEIRNNRFSADFIVASAGLEYNQLEGDLSGVNLVGELVLMTEMEKLTIIPSGAVGIIYYY